MLLRRSPPSSGGFLILKGKRDSIIAKVKSKYWRMTHKFGIQIPKSVDEAYCFDADSRTTFWTEASNKEMATVRIAF